MNQIEYNIPVKPTSQSLQDYMDAQQKGGTVEQDITDVLRPPSFS